MSTERISALETEFACPEEKIKHLETLLLKKEAEFSEERFYMQRKIKRLESKNSKLSEKYTALKNRLKSPDEIITPNVDLEKIEEEYKKLLKEKEETCQLNVQQIEFLRKDYRELQERYAAFSLDYIKDTLKKLFIKLPLMSDDIEKIIEVVAKMLGFSVVEKNEMKNTRAELSKARKGLFSKIFQLN